MDVDLETLLQRTAAAPTTPVEPSRLRRIARRRRTGRRVTGVVAVAGLGLLAVPVLDGLVDVSIPDVAIDDVDASSPVSFDVVLARPGEWTTPSSQTIDEAIRDGVPPTLAMVPRDLRVGSVFEEIDRGMAWYEGPGVDDGERRGVLAWADPRWWETELLEAEEDPCSAGSLCGRAHYGEFLLVDDEGDIVLAHAVPFLMVGDGGGAMLAPDGSGDLIHFEGPSDVTRATVIARLGTTPGDRQVLVYPTEESPFVTTDVNVPLAPPGEQIVLPAGWTVFEPGRPAPDVDDLDAILQALGYDVAQQDE